MTDVNISLPFCITYNSNEAKGSLLYVSGKKCSMIKVEVIQPIDSFHTISVTIKVLKRNFYSFVESFVKLFKQSKYDVNVWVEGFEIFDYNMWIQFKKGETKQREIFFYLFKKHY